MRSCNCAYKESHCRNIRTNKHCTILYTHNTQIIHYKYLETVRTPSKHLSNRDRLPSFRLVHSFVNLKTACISMDGDIHMYDVVGSRREEGQKLHVQISNETEGINDRQEYMSLVRGPQ